MNSAVVARAVLSRIKADTTLWNSGTSAWLAPLAGGAHFMKADPANLLFPLLVYSVQWNADEMPFDGIEGKCDITFTIFDEDTQGTSRLEVLIDRLIGNSMLATPGSRTAPTYGFHNHALSLGSNTQNANSDRWTIISSDIGPSDTVRVSQATLIFTGRVGNQAVNP